MSNQTNGVPTRNPFAKLLPETLRVSLKKKMFQVLKLHWILPSGVIVRVRSHPDDRRGVGFEPASV